MSRLSPEQFERAVQGSRLSERSRELARSVLVDGVALSQAAEAAEVSRQQAYQVKERVLARHLAAGTAGRVKVSAEEFMQGRPHRDALLRAFRGELTKLARAGYPVQVMVQYLKANAVSASAEEIERVLAPLRRPKPAPPLAAEGAATKAALHEDRRPRQPEGRRRKDR